MSDGHVKFYLRFAFMFTFMCDKKVSTRAEIARDGGHYAVHLHSRSQIRYQSNNTNLHCILSRAASNADWSKFRVGHVSLTQSFPVISANITANHTPP